MSITREIHPAGFPIYTLISGENEVVISAFGAQILSWKKSGVPIIFENHDRAILDGKTAYRGGMPICFPYFAKGSLMPLGTTLSPMHGGARSSVWEEESIEDVLILTTDQSAPDGYGPTNFACELKFLLADVLVIEATIENVGGFGSSSDHIEKIKAIAEKIRQNPDQSWGLKDAAATAGYSPFRFSRVFKNVVGYGLHEYVDRCRNGQLVEPIISGQGSVDPLATEPRRSVSAPFQLAVHSYWATREPAKAVVKGLGNRYLDNLLNLTEQTEPDSSIPHEAPVDRVYLDAAPHLELTTESYRLEIKTEGCASAVLWNPGPNHGLKDLGSPDFLCLECGHIVPSKTLEPGESHHIKITYQAQL